MEAGGGENHGAKDVRIQVIEASRPAGFGWSELWASRELLLTLARRDFQVRYKQTALGVSWILLQPLLTAAVFALVFGYVADVQVPGGNHFLFALAGMAGWTIVAGAVQRCSWSLVGNVQLVSKVWFPRIHLPLSSILASLVDAFVLLLVAVVVLLVAGRLSWSSLPLFLFPALGLALLSGGLGLIASAAMVYYRDIQYAIPFGLQLLLYASPVAYPSSSVPERFRELYQLNPFGVFVEGCRASLLTGASWPPAWALLFATGVASLLFLLGLGLFHRLSRSFADAI